MHPHGSAALALLLLGSARPLFAQDSSCHKVAKIEVVGNQRVSSESILSLIRSKTGEPYDLAIADDDIIAIYHTGHFEFVKVKPEGTNAYGTCVLIFEVKEHPAD
jgi:outer membrane protein assembly factor BamA